MNIMPNDTRKSKLNEQIDRNLKRVYAESANEPLPDRFTDLLRQLRDREGKSDSEPGAEPDASVDISADARNERGDEPTE